MRDLSPSFARKEDDNVGSAEPLSSHLKSAWLDVNGISILFVIYIAWSYAYASIDATIPIGKIDYSFYPYKHAINV